MRLRKKLTFSAIAIALAMVTSYLKIASLPFGGSITLFSMFFICLIGYLYGPKTGFAAGAAYGLLQFVTGPYVYHPVQVLLDYPLAFGALGLAGWFRNARHGLMKGVIVGMTGRYICHVVSGYIFFAQFAEGNVVIYTLAYNATYIVPEMIATIAILCVPAVRTALSAVKKMALEP